jgi:hypothetical protein
MIRSSLILATTLAMSAGAASAQTAYVVPDYVAPAYVAPAPVYVAPPPIYVAPRRVVHRYYVAPRASITVAAPAYEYPPAPSETIIDTGW